MSELDRFVKFARGVPDLGFVKILPESTEDDPMVNVVLENGEELAVVSMPPAPGSSTDLCLCDLDLF